MGIQTTSVPADVTTVNLADMIDQVVERTNRGLSDRYLVSISAVERAVNGVIDVIVETLEAGGEVRIRDFGTFGVVHRAERKARNVVAGTSITVPETVVPRFKPAERLKDRVAGR